MWGCGSYVLLLIVPKIMPAWNRKVKAPKVILSCHSSMYKALKHSCILIHFLMAKHCYRQIGRILTKLNSN